MVVLAFGGAFRQRFNAGRVLRPSFGSALGNFAPFLGREHKFSLALTFEGHICASCKMSL